MDGDRSQGIGRQDGVGHPAATDPVQVQLHSLMRVVHWNVKRKARQTRASQLNPPPEADTVLAAVTVEDKMGRIPELNRDATSVSRRGSVKSGPRKSLSDVLKGHERARRASMLLSEALKKDVQRLNKKFRFITRFAILLYRWWKRHSLTEVNSTHPFYMQFQMINDLSDSQSGSAIDFKASYFKANKQMKMSQEAIRILTMPPEQRSKDEIYYAMIALRSIDSIADYPLRMQNALATHGMFQSYGPKRIIVKQGHTPDCFYFILFGTVVVATLELGEPYAKTRVTLRRGENFGELAIAHRTARQSTILTMEYTEFLTIDCDTYENIFMAGGVKTIHDPDHNKFMRSLFFLKDWPFDMLKSNPKALEFCFFRRNTIMVRDSNSSEWIYIVKSGSLRVYKMLEKCRSTVNRRTGHYTVRAHTDGYHSFLTQKSEYNRFAKYHQIDLPPPLGDSDSEDEEPHSPDGKLTAEDKENLLSLPLLQRVERLIRPRTASGGVIATYGHSTSRRHVHTSMGMYKDKIEEKEANSEETESKAETTNIFQDKSGKRTLVDDFENPLKSAHFDDDVPESKPPPALPEEKRASGGHGGGDINPRIISRLQSAFVTELSKKEITAADRNPEFVLIQTLTKGQAFGIQQVFIENQPSLILVSGGAECVMLNKKVYKEHVNPNLAQQLKAQISPFPTDEELQNNLQIRVNWMEYRKITLKNLIAEQKPRKPIQTLHTSKGKQAWP